jgi:citrate lyase beta subunit
MHYKAAASAADVIMLDLEDSVPLASKGDARQQVIHSLQQIDWTAKTVTVRINGLDTGCGYRDLLEVAETAGDHLANIVIPKVDHPRDIHFAARLLDGIELHTGHQRPLGLEASIETAAGLEQVTAIAEASDRVQTLVFGIADYSASIGARLVSLSGHGEREETLYPGHRWHFALSRMVMAGKARNLMVIDAPYGNFKDPQGLQRSAVMACALGCDGKWAIHPGQIDTLNRVFSPTREDIERAGRVLQAFQEAQEKGRGAIAVDGRMVDQATVRLAHQLWDQARHLGMVENTG